MPLRVTEIFYSLQGEGRTVGIPTVFVRLTGCPLRCSYCDTTYAYSGGEWLEQDAILGRIGDYATRYVTITGGEPLAQADCRAFMAELCDRGYQVSLETNGALDIAGLDPRIVTVMDLKTPGSGELKNNHYENLEHLTAHDQLKLVICDRQDYNWAKEMIIRYDLAGICELLMSPAHGRLAPAELAEWILEDQLPVRFQVQLHKVLWGDQPGR